MADLCCAYTIGGGTLNPTDADGLYIGENGVRGLDGRPIRATVDKRGVTDGGIVHPKFWGPRTIVFSGPVGIKSVAIKPNDAYFDAVMAVEVAWIALLEAIRDTPSALAWTPHGPAGAQSLTVTYGVEGGEINFSGSMMAKTFQFALVAETG